MGFLKKTEALAAIVEPQPENTMVTIKPDGHGNAEVRYESAIKDHKHYVDICTGDEYIQNEFGYYEGFRNNSNVIEPDSNRRHCLFAQATLSRMGQKEKEAIIDKLVRAEFPEIPPGENGIKSIEHQAKYDEICIWADENNISPTQVFAFWGPIRRDTGCTDASLELLKNKIMQSMLERAETAKREVFGAAPAAKPPSRSGTTAQPASTNDQPRSLSVAETESTTLAKPPQNAVVTVDTETGEIEMPREEFLWLLKLQDSQLDSFEASELENIDKLLWACNVLTADCFRLANLATAAINKNLSFMAGLLYKFGGGLREYTEPKLKKGTKTWKSPNLTGSVHYKKTGGWKCTNKSELIEHARRMTDEQIEACPWARIDVVIDQRLANKWVKENNEKLPGYELIPVHETGIMQIGDGKPFSLGKLRTALKSIRISNLTNYTGSDDDDESEEE